MQSKWREKGEKLGCVCVGVCFPLQRVLASESLAVSVGMDSLPRPTLASESDTALVSLCPN